LIYKSELLRKSIHLCNLIIPFTYLFYFHSKIEALIVLGPITLFALIIEYLRTNSYRVKNIFNKYLFAMLRKHEKNGKYTGATWVFIASTISIAVFPKEIAVISLVFMAIGDTTAGLIGRKIGKIKFYNKLIKIDPQIEEKINPTDVQRSIRAYEIKLYTKKSLIDWFKNTKSKFTDDDFVKIYIDFPRQELLTRISSRVDHMFIQGAINEVRKFLKLKIAIDKTPNKIIGINEIKDFLNKKSDLNEVKEKITIKTRQYAKRQSTWARGQMMDWQKVNPKDLKNFLKKI